MDVNRTNGNVARSLAANGGHSVLSWIAMRVSRSMPDVPSTLAALNNVDGASDEHEHIIGKQEQHKSAKTQACSSKTKVVLMVSAPETGPDNSGGYTFPVMENILQLSKTAENMVVAYDWAGSSNVFPEDQANFDMVFKDQASSFGNLSLLKKLGEENKKDA
jgi:hypothetical protein